MLLHEVGSHINKWVLNVDKKVIDIRLETYVLDEKLMAMVS
jgi:hypothetical protein